MNYRFIISEVLKYRCLHDSVDLQNNFGKMHAASSRTKSSPVLALRSGRKSHILLHVTTDMKDILLGLQMTGAGVVINHQGVGMICNTDSYNYMKRN